MLEYRFHLLCHNQVRCVDENLLDARILHHEAGVQEHHECFALTWWRDENCEAQIGETINHKGLHCTLDDIMLVWALHDSIKLQANLTHLIVGHINRLPLTEQYFNCRLVLGLVSSNLLLDLLDCLRKEGG